MTNSVIITLIICITIVIIGIIEIILKYIEGKMNFSSCKVDIELEQIKYRLKRLEEKEQWR